MPVLPLAGCCITVKCGKGDAEACSDLLLQLGHGHALTESTVPRLARNLALVADVEMFR